MNGKENGNDYNVIGSMSPGVRPNGVPKSALVILNPDLLVLSREGGNIMPEESLYNTFPYSLLRTSEPSKGEPKRDYYGPA